MATYTNIPHSVSLVTAPTEEPLTYVRVRALLQIGNDEQQEWLTAQIVAARQHVESDTSKRLVTQTVDVRFDGIPSDGVIRMPVEPLQSITSITVTASDGTTSVVASSDYVVDTASAPPRIFLADGASWPVDVRALAGVTVRCVVGYGAASAVPGPLVLAMEQLIAAWYAARVGGSYVPPPRWMGYDTLVAPYRLMGIA